MGLLMKSEFRLKFMRRDNQVKNSEFSNNCPEILCVFRFSKPIHCRCFYEKGAVTSLGKKEVGKREKKLNI